MASSAELSLDFKPHSYFMLLKSFAASGDRDPQQPEPKQLEDFLACLEDERLKIEAFKRELPLCMQLLSNAMEASRQKLEAVKSSSNGSRPVLEELIPLKSPTGVAGADQTASNNMMAADKSNWMVPAQLWSQTAASDNYGAGLTMPSNQTEMGLNISPSSIASDTSKQRNSGAFTPFNKDRSNTSSPTLPNPNVVLINTANEHEQVLEDKKQGPDQLISDFPTREITMIPSPGDNINVERMIAVNEATKGTSNNSADISIASQAANTNSNNTNGNNTSNQQPHRKARRCWSPDLHRRFVAALNMLGGSQVATPKQIRELMKVDGLTNDEVKSHLQKYRLHTRRPSPSPQPHLTSAGGPGGPAQLVLLGGIWVPPEYASHPGATAAAIYGGSPHHQPPSHHFQAQPGFFASPHHRQLFDIHQQQQMQMVQMQHQQMQNQQQQGVMMYDDGSHKNKASSRTHSSSDAAGDRSSESIDVDGKSESGSWKGENGVVESGNKRGGDQESNGSAITLKF